MNYEMETQVFVYRSLWLALGRSRLIDRINDHNQFIIFYDSDARPIDEKNRRDSMRAHTHTHTTHASKRLAIHRA